MADPLLVELLRQGSKVWNDWQEQQPEGQQFNLLGVRLSGANLNDIFLRGADLRGADLHNANLSDADLRDADLREAILNGALLSDAYLNGTQLLSADLRGADLRGADLRYANLSSADLSYGDLHNADLRGSYLNGTLLEKADWTNMRIGWTIFGNLDLRTIIGLDTVKHEGPSTIGLDTIYHSYGQISESFLRRTGIPDTFITNMRALVESMSPIEFYTCFISYSSQNGDFAKRLYADLQREGVRCWFASEDLKIGDHYHQRIDEAIRLYDKLILVLSEQAVQSAWVEREVVAAREKEDHQQRGVLFPIRLDDTVMRTTRAWAADVRRRWHIGDFTRWKNHDSYQQAFERLLHDLKAEHKPKD